MPETSRDRLGHIRPVLNQWNHKTYTLMGPSSCHTMPSWLNERWVQRHETPEVSWGKAQLCLSRLVSLSDVTTFKRQGKLMKSAMSEIYFNLMWQELLSYKSSLSLSFSPSMGIDLRQRFRECLLYICKKVAIFFVFLKERCCSKISFKALDRFIFAHIMLKKKKEREMLLFQYDIFVQLLRNTPKVMTSKEKCNIAPFFPSQDYW